MTRLRPPGRRPSPSVSPRRPAALRPGTRLGGGGRRTPTVRRASAGLTPSRAGALLALLLAVGGVYGAVSSDAFAARSVVVDGTTWTPESVVTDTLAIPAGQNLFTLRTGPLLEALARIPAVRSASIEVALPDEVRVHVTERRALIVWQAAGRRMLVDDQGYLFASLPDTVPQAAGALPVITDARSSGEALVVGSTLDAQDLDAALRLGSLVPTDLGSGAARLQLRVDDTDGYTIRAVPTGWTAVFGFYTPTLRRTDLIPGQVRLLRSLLAGREAGVLRIILADDRSGTYVPRPSPSPAASETP